MVTFKGTPNMLVRLNPPVGRLSYVRFDAHGEFTTDNARMIQRFHHKFDSLPTDKDHTEEVNEHDLELQEQVKVLACKKCDFTTGSKGLLLAHYRAEHPKEG